MNTAPQLATEGPSRRDVELYFFTFQEALDMLKCSEHELRARVTKWQFGAVRWDGEWYIPPASIPLLREHLWGIR